MELNTLLYLAIMIAVGMLFGRLVKFIRLPNVTGYLIGGLLIGPSVLGIVPADALEGLNIISEVALGFIAFSIGNEFKVSYFKRVGKAPIVIAVFESLLAVVFVFVGLIISGRDISFSLCLASIAAATAPAATIMVINQYKAKGPVTETLLSVVAIDDATALILFSVCTTVAQMISNPGGTSIKTAVLDPLWEIFGAILVGAVLGLLFTVPLRWFKKDGNRLAITIGMVFLAVGLSEMLGLSSLLCCMALGAVFTNVSSQYKHISKLTDFLTPPIFILFFVISGAELKLSVIPQIGIIGVIYIVLRVAGKMVGATTGAAMCKCEKNIKKYLGPALLPQAGVAIGLSLAATKIVPQYATEIRTVILCGTLIYELIGPMVTKISLKKAGEIKEDRRKVLPKPESQAPDRKQ